MTRHMTARQRRARKPARRAVTALILALACVPEDRSEGPWIDTAGLSHEPVAPDDAALAPAAESLVAVPDRTRAADSSDTTAVAATSEELAELAAQLIIPVAGVQPGELRDTYTESRGNRPHDAIDIPAARGTAVVSAANGKLMKLHNSVPGGLMVYAADQSDRFIFMYGHLDAYAPGLTEGMSLRQGQLLGYVGTSGNAPPGTPHLHFAIARGRPSVSWWRGTAVNPYPLLSRARPAPVQ